jgi:hypothetical protein
MACIDSGTARTPASPAAEAKPGSTAHSSASCVPQLITARAYAAQGLALVSVNVEQLFQVANPHHLAECRVEATQTQRAFSAVDLPAHHGQYAQYVA